MLNFVTNLRKQIDPKIEAVELSENSVLKKSIEILHLIGNAFDQLRTFILSYHFKDETEEILFFKEIKPRFCYRLVYYRKIYNIEMNRPVGEIETQKAYLSNELDEMNKYIAKRQDFIRHYRSGATLLDSLYFVRGKENSEQYLETFYYELDPDFSTNCDYKVTKILANDLLLTYLMSEIDKLDNYSAQTTYSFPKVKITWKGGKTNLTEQIYGWDSMNAFGDIPLTQLSAYIQNVFNIDLDNNLSRSFSDMRIRVIQTPFLDDMKTTLLKRMQFTKPKKPKKVKKVH
jgi:hypothetical protein